MRFREYIAPTLYLESLSATPRVALFGNRTHFHVACKSKGRKIWLGGSHIIFSPHSNDERNYHIRATTRNAGTRLDAVYGSRLAEQNKG